MEIETREVGIDVAGCFCKQTDKMSIIKKKVACLLETVGLPCPDQIVWQKNYRFLAAFVSLFHSEVLQLEITENFRI